MRTFGLAVLYLLSAYVVYYAISVFGFRPLGAHLPPTMRLIYETHAFAIYTHIFAAVFALALGPFQFWAGLRRRHKRLHRWLGRAYLGVGVLFGGLGGLYMSAHAQGGPVAQLGFACLALAWLYTGAQAYRSIRAGDVDAHRGWMVRNYALTLAAVTLRVYLPVSIMSGVPFATAYAVIAWACWVPNLLLAEMLCKRGRAALPAGAPAA